jgi:hypothetical protein
MLEVFWRRYQHELSCTGERIEDGRTGHPFPYNTVVN